MTLPQLRIRTEFSFRQAYGPVARVAEVLKGMETPAAAIVDKGTWGHVKWAKACAKAGLEPLFGTEVVIPLPDGRKPTAWALAESAAGFYQFSTAARDPEADPAQEFAMARGTIRFAGDALTDPDCFDYIDINPGSPMVIRAKLELAKRTGKPLVVTSDNRYPAPTDFNAFMAIVDRQRTTPQYILTEQQLARALERHMTVHQLADALDNTRTVAERCMRKLPVAPIIKVPGDLRKLADEGKWHRIHSGQVEWTDVYEARLQRELTAVEQKDFQSYFIVVADLIRWAKERMFVGPGRGSSAGSLLCWCLGITEVDPLPHGLLFERFIDLTRKDLPDIDIDFNDNKRDMVFDYLREKYGHENVARLGNVNTFKPRSILAEVCKRLDIPDYERFNLANALIEYSSGDSRYGKGLEDTLHNTEVGQNFTERHPESSIMTTIEGHASHTGIHAAGVIVCNEPVSHFCTVGKDGVAQIDKPDSEALNLLKIDALGLRTLGVLEDAGVITGPELYRMTLDDPAVFDIFNQKKYAALFQFEGQSQRTISAQVPVHDFKTIDHLTALSRPGPLGGGATNKYIQRIRGEEWELEPWEKIIQPIVGDTLGLVLYQEQVMRIVREIGKFTWDETTVIRKAMSGRKGKEYFDQQGDKFVKGAAQDGISEHDARAIWESICNFGAWGMNKSHTCAYAVVSYWCAWMKAYHPLEYAASCLRNAKNDDQVLAILREVTAEGIEYVPFDFWKSGVHWAAVDGKLVGGFRNIPGYGPAKARKAVEDRDSYRMKQATMEKIMAMPVKFRELYPLHAAYPELYANPESYGCREGSVVLTHEQLPEEGEVLYFGTLIEKEARDENETIRLARRGGRKKDGPTKFADLVVKDDSGMPIIARIGRFKFEPMGRVALKNLVVGQDVILIRGTKIRNFPMIQVERIKCLNRPEALHEQPAATTDASDGATQALS